MKAGVEADQQINEDCSSSFSGDFWLFLCSCHIRSSSLVRTRAFSHLHCGFRYSSCEGSRWQMRLNSCFSLQWIVIAPMWCDRKTASCGREAGEINTLHISVFPLLWWADMQFSPVGTQTNDLLTSTQWALNSQQDKQSCTVWLQMDVSSFK